MERHLLLRMSCCCLWRQDRTCSSTVQEDDLPLIYEENIDFVKSNKQINLEIKQMIEKEEDVWKCKVCGKHASSRPSIQYHAKTHTDGISVSCHICSKILTNKQTLRQHISGNHSELFSCDICGKAGMKKANYYIHKRNNHQIKSAWTLKGPFKTINPTNLGFWLNLRWPPLPSEL